MNEKIDVSIVIIAKNEGRYIERCLDSVMETFKDNDLSTEIILVDSCSSDNTIEIAKRYPIDIFHIPLNVFKSPAAGMYVGIMKSKGKYIQIMGGDMTLDNSWVPEAISFLNSSSKGILGVFGMCSQEPYDVELAKQYAYMFKNANLHKEYTTSKNRWVGGILFKDIIRNFDNLNPYLPAHVEEEFVPRIKKMGYSLDFLDIPMNHHYGADEEDQMLIKNRLKRVWYTEGFLLKLAFHNKDVFSYWIPKYKWFFSYTYAIIISASFLLTSILIRNKYLFFITMAMVLGWFGYQLIKKKNVRKIIHKYFVTLRGFGEPYKTGKNYPLNKILKIK